MAKANFHMLMACIMKVNGKMAMNKDMEFMRTQVS